MGKMDGARNVAPLECLPRTHDVKQDEVPFSRAHRFMDVGAVRLERKTPQEMLLRDLR
jgi:hypothetical protein